MTESNFHIISTNFLVGWLAVILLVLLALTLVVENLRSLFKVVTELLEDINRWRKNQV
jgi:hypothetical protein